MRVIKSRILRSTAIYIVPFIAAICLCFISTSSVHAATFTVMNTNDSGSGSLRQAILDANANPGADTIDFDTAGVFATPQTIMLTSGQLEITDDLTISGTGAHRLTIAGSGAAFRIFSVNSPAAIISGLLITGGNDPEGAGIRNYGNLTLNNCTVDSNSGAQPLQPEGGGIYNSGTLTINSSTISRNRAYAAAGVLNHGTLTVTNSTFLENSAQFGGALYNDQTLTINNSTISDNRAGTGGGIYTTGGTVTLLSTIVANNSAVSGHGNDIQGTVTSGHYCLVEDPNGASISGANNITGVDPMLASPALNGGSTETIALLLGSPAIDNGKNPNGLADDQRGQPRTVNDLNVADAVDGDGTDIGAVESNFLVVNTTAQDDDGACQPLAVGDCTLREAITAANAAPGMETIVFDIPTNDPGYDAVTDRYTIALTSVLPDLDSDMEISGLGAKRLTVKRIAPPQQFFRIFTVNNGTTVTISGLTISGGDIGQSGGGVANSGTLTILNSTLSGNRTGDNGGAIFNTGTLAISGTTLTDNRGVWGGGVSTIGGTLVITNSTLSGNRADIGGAIYDRGTVTLSNSTVSNNSSQLSADGIDNNGGGTLNLNSSIVANNNHPGFSNSDIRGTVSSGDFNLIENTSSISGSLPGTHNITGIDPKLAPLADNGGPTQTHALLCESPAIDQGKKSAEATDQRGSGFARSFNDPSVSNAADGTDIGAFEVQAPLVCNTAPVANDDSYSTNEDNGRVGVAPGVLGNDTDAEANPLTASQVSGPAHAKFFSLAPDGAFLYIPVDNYNGTDSFTYKANDGSLDSNVATVTITVNPVNDAPVASATPNSQSVQYSDPISNVTVTATDIDSTTLTATTTFKVGAGAFGNGLPSGLSLASPVCAPSGSGTGCQWTLSGKANVAAGTYVIRVTVSDGGLTASSDVTLIVNKEKTETIYTGDVFMFTAGPTVTTANVRLSAQLTQQADGNAGDITKAKVSFLLFKSSNLGATPDLTVSGVPVDAAGATLKSVNLGVDTWTIKVKIDADNGYWKASPVGMGTVTVEQPTNELRTSGGGWVADAQSMNGKGNFGFNVANQKNGVRGGSVYLFRGPDGFNYLVKNTSWQSGGIGFSSEGAILSKAAFSGKCVVQKIDSDTGEIVNSFGNYSFTVDVRDGDLFNPRQVDKYAITVLGSNGLVWRQIGSRTNPPAIGGGNISVKAK